MCIRDSPYDPHWLVACRQSTRADQHQVLCCLRCVARGGHRTRAVLHVVRNQPRNFGADAPDRSGPRSRTLDSPLALDSRLRCRFTAPTYPLAWCALWLRLARNHPCLLIRVAGTGVSSAIAGCRAFSTVLLPLLHDGTAGLGE